MCTRGMVERRAPRRACAGEMHGTQAEQLHAEKAAGRRRAGRSIPTGKEQTSDSDVLQVQVRVQSSHSGSPALTSRASFH